MPERCADFYPQWTPDGIQLLQRTVNPSLGDVLPAEPTGATGLEPATSGVTGRRSNQLNYAPAVARAR